MLALVLLAIVAAVCFSLGMWQLQRAAERDALHDSIERGRLQAPVVLSASSRAAELTPWRAATAQGHWLPQHTVLLENRNLDGQPGYWVATPLLLEADPVPPSRNDAVTAGSAEIGAVVGNGDTNDFLGKGPAPGTTAVLVLRGWLPRDMQAGGSLPTLPEEPGLVRVTGELHAHVPRIFELWEWAGGKASALPATLPPPDNGVAVVQNLELADYAAATGLRLLPAVLAQTQGDSASPLKREWPGPSLDSDQNRGYALQWFSFSAIAAIAGLVVLRNLFRRSGRSARGKESP